MIPQSHPYIKNYLETARTCAAWATRCAWWSRTPTATSSTRRTWTLKKVNDELVLTPGVDRAWMKSLWTPAVRWTEVTEEGLPGGPVMPDNYDGSPRAVSSCAPTSRAPASSAAWWATTSRSSMIFVPLLDRDSGDRQARSTTAAFSHCSRRNAEVRGGAKVRRDAGDQDPRHRLRQAGRRPDRRPGPGDELLPSPR